MKKFLSTFGRVFLRVGAVLPELQPFIGLLSGFLPPNAAPTTAEGKIEVAVGDAVKMIQIVAKAEIVVQTLMGPDGNGPAKLKIAAPEISILFETAVEQLGLKVANEAGAATALTGIAANVADFVNCLTKK